jgi:effector-binding domain-containing protein
MMTYALGGRAKWKDYVDLYFILKNHFSLNQIIDNTDIVFGNFFNAKLLLEQLSFYEDIDNSEPVIYLNEKPSDEKIKTFLTETALNF